MTERVIVTKLLPIVPLAVIAAGCGSTLHGVAGARHCKPAQEPLRSVAAVVTRPAAAYREPGGRVVARFGLENVNHVPTVFGVVGRRINARCRATWLHVQLPIRPNGATGWVRADHVQTARIRARIVVDLSEKRVRFYKGGRLVLSTRAAIGSPATPTPVGRYYVNQRLIPTDPSGPFGPGAIGISAFSPVLTGWAQGGPIAIHGTNAPWSIGHAVSNGCIRIPNDALRRVFRQTPAGTPVLIRQ
jgi:lipoprotein-anchoring transpeptidase ErfK/SrfK